MPPTTPSRVQALAGLALTSAIVVAHEVLMTRLLSVVTWYALGFFVLSIAMLGLTAGALQALRARAAGAPLGPWLAERTILLAVSIIVSLVAALAIPLLSEPTATAFVAMLVVAGAMALPMVAGGGIVTRLMSELDVPIGVVYAVDLAGAAAGALAPLALLGPFDGPSAVLVLAVAAAACGLLVAPRGQWRVLAVGATLVLGFGAVANNGAEKGLAVSFVKHQFEPTAHAAYAFEGWNALSNVRIRTAYDVQHAAALWGPSPKTPPGTVRSALALIDGDAGTVVHQFHDLHELEFLRYDVTNVVHWLRPDGPACVIGVGGGRDLESALVAGHSEVLGVEVNPLIVDMLRALQPVSPILADPRVTVIVGDGRSVLARRAPHCRTLQASLVDTWASTGAGAFAHTEATIYTREAWAQFLTRVAPDGLLTFSRWYDPSAPREIARLASLAVAALLDHGLPDPSKAFAVVAAGHVATLLESPVPFSAADIATLHARAEELGFRVLIAPDTKPVDETLARITAARSLADLDEAGLPVDLDTSPPTDDRPFFFQLLAPRAWLHILDLMRGSRGGGVVIPGNFAATLQLHKTFFAVAIVAFLLLGPALRRGGSVGPSLPGRRAAVYFGALGAGFMLAEVALVQRMHVALGHPTYALVVVLAGLLVSTGLGSALSERFMRTRRATSRAALVAAVVLIVLPRFVIGPMARATEASSLGARCLWAGAVAGVVGLVLGTLFPSGVRFVARDRGVPRALALTGTTSVIGGVLAVIVSVTLGIPATFALAGLAYLVAAWAGPHGWSALEP
ncbi:MAG: hypothetical protein JWM82_2306 [Myxococcales bacterium]|nr:hypothetical protein [Myxococcales bacterium]